jgi:hypothetical protein
MWQPNKLSALDLLLADKWKKIASSLGIEIITPFKIIANETEYKYAVLIKNFGLEGATNGLLMRAHPLKFIPEQCGAIWDVAIENGYLPMDITEYGINILDENEAKNSYLEFYKWFGSEDLKPNWHTGDKA